MAAPDRTELLAGMLDKYERIGITGEAGTGKSQLAASVGSLRRVFACDTLLPLPHDQLADAVIAACPDGPVIVEGCAVPWAVRAGLKLDAILVLTQVHDPHPQAEGLGKGVFTVLGQIDVPKVYEMNKITLNVIGEIGMDTTEAQFVAALVPGVTDVELVINSPGGNAIDGFAIYNRLKASGAKVVAKVVGMCASAASIIAMAADEIDVAQNAIMMIHKASGGMFGTAEELKAKAETLTKIDQAMIGIYASRTGHTEAEITKLLSQGDHWMSADEAKSEGFATKIIPDKVPVAQLRRLDPVKLRGAPASFLAAVTAARSEPIASNGANGVKHVELKDIIGALSGLTKDQRTALVKHAESEAALAGLFVTEEVAAQASAGKAIGSLLGKSGDAAVGAVAALKAAEARSVELEKTVADLALKDEAREVNDLLAANRDRVTPVQRTEILSKYQDKTLSIGAIKAMVPLLPLIPGMKPTVRPVVASAGELKHEGMTYAELSAKAPSKLVALKKEQPELWAAMREDAIAKGQIS